MKKVTFQGNELTLVGEQIKVGDVAPNFKAVKPDLSEFTLGSLKGKTVVITSMPSVDTPVCELQTIRFNKEAGKLDKVHVITISEDLPFAIGRFCANKEIKSAITLSDYKDHDFANKYGLLIKELNLLGRTVIVIDKEGIVRYVEIVPEITHEPNYEEALNIIHHVR
ncbi:thiol peroxidase (atypical 2-Cys peroxiredoxin) [Cetobacterium ceti]|uniref:Thiol peroxidase (Atypical 2-Cys peroxiredoxin) n=1 Tax=Cetobacterium ceti TaxID=180163 RepID=A0A1T4LM73_9FUSO|nr:thiol peroxidase [Cetobacterium ceti]SJZ55840.1 thiol peroxidase (atypical 2-Cys peroxiredoxin) [Cetobacterium ceti]